MMTSQSILRQIQKTGSKSSAKDEKILEPRPKDTRKITLKKGTIKEKKKEQSTIKVMHMKTVNMWQILSNPT